MCASATTLSSRPTEPLIRAVVLETELQANTGVDQDLFAKGWQLAIERNGGKYFARCVVAFLG